MPKLLVIRNDKLGDFMLAWPAFAMLKQSAPEWKITALVPVYTAELAHLCPYLDEVIIDAGRKADNTSKNLTQQAVNAQKFDACINFFSDAYNALLTWRARIPYRLAPATKWVQIFYNRRVTQRRSRSEKPEFIYNLDLAQAFLNDHNFPIVMPQPPFLHFSTEVLLNQKQKLSRLLNIENDKSWIFIHSGSGGSANNLSLEQYAELTQGLLKHLDVNVILTAGPTEKARTVELSQILSNERVKIYAENDGLVDFAKSLACADLFIAGSTGPLHLAAALNCPTIGFFPSKRSATPLRWQPINESNRHLAFCPAKNKPTEDDLSTI